jgi:DNA modification methylase
MTPKPHPAKFSTNVIDTLQQIVPPGLILDNFAGIGGIHVLRNKERKTIGVEIEPEWANQSRYNIVGDALDLPFPDNTFDTLVTSPVYSNRMSDSHVAKDSSRRITYTHYLGRKLHENNSGKMQWSDKYRKFHEKAWKEGQRVLKPGGLFFLNISDHIRKGQVQPVTAWHRDYIIDLGFAFLLEMPIKTPRMKFGANRDIRIDHESILIFENGKLQ